MHLLLGLVVRVRGRLLDVLGDVLHLSGVVSVHEFNRLSLKRAILDGELGLVSNVSSLRWGLADGRRNENLKVTVLGLTQARVLGEQALLLHPGRNTLNLGLGDIWGVGVVGSHVAGIWEAQVQRRRVIGAEDGAFGGLVELGGLRGCGRKGSDALRGASGDELGVTKALVVASVPEEHGSVLEEVSELGLVNTGLLTESAPVAIAALVQGQNQVIDGLRLWGELA